MRKQPVAQFPDALKQEFCLYCRILYDSHLVAGVGGNLSVRAGSRIMATPTGYSLRNLSPDMVVVLDKKGEVSSGPTPTKDIQVHLGILKKRTDIEVVCHVHGPFIIALSSLMEPGPDVLPPLTPGFVYLAHPLAMTPFLVPGSKELTRVALGQFERPGCRALLLQNHGLITVGKDFEEALNIAEEIDEAARVFLLTRGRAKHIPEEDVGRIKSLT